MEDAVSAKANGRAKNEFQEAIDASKAAKAKSDPPREFTEDISVELTADEITKLGAELAEIHGRRQARDEEKKELLRGFRVLDKPDRLREDEVAQSVREKKALRPTLLQEHKVFETGKAVTTIKETGVLYRERALTAAERQAPLPFGEPEDDDDNNEELFSQ